MIKKINIFGVFGDIKFNSNLFHDINILTGKNGCGKTTLLKSLWYLYSGKFEYLFKEITFKYFELQTDSFQIVIETKNEDFEIKYTPNDGTIFQPLRVSSGFPIDRNSRMIKGFHDILNHRDFLQSASVYFPTFRRIEGGYSSLPFDEDLFSNSTNVKRRRMITRETYQRGIPFYEQHSFITSISTVDIIELFTSRYAEISAIANYMQNELSTRIINDIQQYSDDKSKNKKTAEDTLNEIRNEVIKVQKNKDTLFSPITELSKLSEQIFKEKGIEITQNISLGSKEYKILSDKLSAGEKQMLSFLAYNAFYSNTTFFIDEPELSLHVDWQRILFPILLKQNPTNQFIISTHSPFVYSKYADKEHVISRDKGE